MYTLYQGKKNFFFFGEMNVWSTINNNRKSSICFTEFKAASILSLIAKSLQSCRTLYDPIDGSPPGSPIPGILQARTLEWVAVSFSNAWKWKVKVKSLSPVWLLATPWIVATRLLHPWDFPDKSNGVGCHCLLWFVDSIILYIENPNDAIKRLLEIINKYSESGCKISIQKSIAFLLLLLLSSFIRVQLCATP